ncbi:hypothetical protein COL26b_001450 [Colletotrichum chrysophilum]|uniref:uncharacterized protein n=1 Tax=Colletotrichum chrysophilum TaxID=1836956 RepID=UPI002301F91F|nr:uncharacterized protein COL26b_001450 [Colletotrichum chrysophilum]KAJ0380334.1 hypothetical protein COL26b_001450 [Colletotrichum chrysophilum]
MGPKLDMMAQDKPNPEEASNALSSSTLIPDSQLEKQVLRKLDLRLAPLFATLYFVAYLDRSNIGNAAVAGLTEDLGLSGSQFSTAVSIFFATSNFSWLYIIEGLISLLAVTWVWFGLPNDPTRAKFWKPEEREVMLAREAQRQEYLGSQVFEWKEVFNAFKDPKVYST